MAPTCAPYSSCRLVHSQYTNAQAPRHLKLNSHVLNSHTNTKSVSIDLIHRVARQRLDGVAIKAEGFWSQHKRVPCVIESHCSGVRGAQMGACTSKSSVLEQQRDRSLSSSVLKPQDAASDYVQQRQQGRVAAADAIRRSMQVMTLLRAFNVRD